MCVLINAKGEILTQCLVHLDVYLLFDVCFYLIIAKMFSVLKFSQNIVDRKPLKISNVF